MFTAIPMPMDQIFAFCRRWKITEFAVFGSVLREDFGPESDIDVLIDYPRDAGHTLFTWVQMREELEQIFGRRVDLLGRRGVERGRNPSRRNRILDSARVLHAA
jgi:predicted nucleotidyltransferase